MAHFNYYHFMNHFKVPITWTGSQVQAFLDNVVPPRSTRIVLASGNFR